MGILFYNSGFGKNYGTTLMYTNFGRLFQFDLYGSEEQWSLSLLDNPLIPDESMVQPVSDEYLSILSIMTYRRETKNTASYDTDLFYQLVSEYYHQNHLWMDDREVLEGKEDKEDKEGKEAKEGKEGSSPFDVVDLSDTNVRADKYVIVEEHTKKDINTKHKKKPKKSWGFW
jgi:hypothetical protein